MMRHGALWRAMGFFGVAISDITNLADATRAKFY